MEAVGIQTLAQRFLFALDHIASGERQNVEAWVDADCPGEYQQFKSNVLTEEHLSLTAFPPILRAMGEAFAQRTSWSDAFESTASNYYLHGDPITCSEPDVLDRVVRLVHLSRPFRTATPGQTGVIAMYAQDLDLVTLDELRRWRPGGSNAVAWATFAGVDGLPDECDAACRVPRTQPLARDNQWFSTLTAEEVILRLGIPRWRPQDLLILTYSRPMDGSPLRFPTIVEAGLNHRTFRPAPRTYPCGFTRHLQTGEPCMPEIVHRNEPLGDTLIMLALIPPGSPGLLAKP